MRTLLIVSGLWFVCSAVLALFLGRVFRLGRLVVMTAACAAAGSTAAAQERIPQPAWSAYTVMVAGNVADIWTTHQAFERGAHEANGFTTTTQIGWLAVSKACMVLALGTSMRLLERHGHPRIAKVVGYLDGGVTSAVAIHNAGLAPAGGR